MCPKSPEQKQTHSPVLQHLQQAAEAEGLIKYPHVSLNPHLINLGLSVQVSQASQDFDIMSGHKSTCWGKTKQMLVILCSH